MAGKSGIGLKTHCHVGPDFLALNPTYACRRAGLRLTTTYQMFV
jgi:hypothetical protein